MDKEQVQATQLAAIDWAKVIAALQILAPVIQQLIDIFRPKPTA